MKKETPDAQFVFWMKELTEITLFDFIFSQQDRVGNIDYVDYWYWLEDDQVHRARASGPGRPNNVPSGALLLKRTHLNDNDAAARAHFRMVDPPVYDMVVSIWVDSMEQVGAFRQYLEALQESPLEFADWSRSFFLYTRQVRIIDDAPPKE